MKAKVAVAILVASMCGAAWLGAHGARVDAALAFTFAWLPYAWLARSPRVPSPGVVRAAFVLIVAIFVVSPSFLSDDLYRYIWDGRVLLAGFDPYAHAPDSPALAGLRDASWARINHPELPTLYPPVAIGFFALVAPLAALGAFGPRLLAIGAHLWLARSVGDLVPSSRRSMARAMVLLNPLLLVEGALGGHVDMLAAAFVVGGIRALRGPGDRAVGLAHPRAIGVATLFAIAAIGTKLVGWFLAPALLTAGGGEGFYAPATRGNNATRKLRFSTRRAKALALVSLVLATALFVAPAATAGYGDRGVGSGFGAYARSWRGHGPVFLGAEAAANRLLRASYPERYGQLVDPLPRVLSAVADTPFDPRAAFARVKKARPSLHLLHVSALSSWIARGWMILAFGLVGLWTLRRPPEPLLATRRMALAAALLSPQVHPWYLALLVALDLAAGRVAGLALGAAAFAAYAPLELWWTTRQWDAASWPAFVAAALCVALIAFEFVRDRTQDPRQSLTPRADLP